METPVQTTDSLYTISVSHQDATLPDFSLRASFKSDTAPKCLRTLPGVPVPEVWLEALVSGTYSLSLSTSPLTEVREHQGCKGSAQTGSHSGRCRSQSTRRHSPHRKCHYCTWSRTLVSREEA